MGKNRSFAYADRAAAVIAGPAHAVGRIKKAYGTRAADDTMNGELLVTLYDAFPESVDTTEPLWVEIDSLAAPLFIASFEPKGQSSAVILFDDFEREEEARMLIGKVLYHEEAETEGDEDEIDLSLWIGFELTDRATGRTGQVTAFYDYPGNPLLGVEFDGHEVMVPAVEGVIVEANERKRRLVAELPEGLFEL